MRPSKRQITLIALGVIAIVLVVVMTYALPSAVDWHTAFRPAALAVLRGKSPYSVYGYFNAPWALLPLLPLAILPEEVGRALLVVISLAVLAYTAHKMGAKPTSVILLLLSPPAMHGLLHGNIDWLAAFGFILPPQIGMFFISVKPQIGIAVGIYWVIEAWRESRWRGVWRVLAPISIAFVLSFLLFGLWPLRFERELSLWWNASLWPASLPVGLALMVLAIRKREMNFAIGASPCFAPYILLHSWIGALFAIIKAEWELFAVVLGLWGVVILRAIA